MSKSRQDHYYWLTAELAARGLQARVSRVIAFLNLGMGFVPALLIASPMGPHGVVPETLAAGIALFCVISAAIWLRPHAWPSRRVSAVSVILGGLWTSVACLIMSNPLLGLLTATTYMLGTVLEGLAGIAVAQGHPERAARLFGAAAALRTRMGVPLLPANERLYQRQVTRTQDALGEDRWAMLWEEGRVMTRDEAVAYGLDGGAARHHGLVQRETDATGQSNVSATTQP